LLSKVDVVLLSFECRGFHINLCCKKLLCDVLFGCSRCFFRLCTRWLFII
jgi:hypothetical protein